MLSGRSWQRANSLPQWCGGGITCVYVYSCGVHRAVHSRRHGNSNNEGCVAGVLACYRRRDRPVRAHEDALPLLHPQVCILLKQCRRWALARQPLAVVIVVIAVAGTCCMVKGVRDTASTEATVVDALLGNNIVDNNR
jgi:hypothetical protein